MTGTRLRGELAGLDQRLPLRIMTIAALANGIPSAAPHVLPGAAWNPPMAVTIDTHVAIQGLEAAADYAAYREDRQHLHPIH